MKRVFNFSPGPAMLPHAVLEQPASELLDWHGSGMSVMEMSHRGKRVHRVSPRRPKTNLRELLAVPANYKVLFLQGGATLQFAAVPLNLAPPGVGRRLRRSPALGSKKAIGEAKRYAEVNVAADSSATKFTTIPAPSTWKLSQSAAYLHYTPNETDRSASSSTSCPTVVATRRSSRTCRRQSCRGRST